MSHQEHGPKQKPGGCITVALIILGVSIPVIGILAALGIHGMRKYLVAAKSAEARASIGAIARAAVASFEKSSAGTGRPQFCRSAVPVPARVPPGMKYMPSQRAGEDYRTGSTSAGWLCLGYSTANPSYYQYNYSAGSGYLVPSTAPGPDGFEAAAIGDLDGDLTVSTFALTGKNEGGRAVISPSLITINEEE